MYPPSAQYTSLPTSDPGSGPGFQPSRALNRLTLGRRKRLSRPLLLLLSLSSLVILAYTFTTTLSPPSSTSTSTALPATWSPTDISFPASSRPSYLSHPPPTPLRLRIAIMSRVDEFARRQLLRDVVLRGVGEEDVRMEYRFFVGRPDGWRLRMRLWWEGWWVGKGGDVVVFGDLKDIPQRLSDKRFRALKWTNAIPPSSYDYSLTLDSDTFCRLPALARRMAHVYPSLHPTSEPILLGRMAGHLVYFQNTVPDGNVDDEEEDALVKGPWYDYPMGIGYMLSSNITHTLLSADPALPHHIKYPSDDVMIGAWLAGLDLFHSPSTIFETTPEHSPPPQHRVYPTPYLPYRVRTNVVDDKAGWHNVLGRGGNDGVVGWESVCVHRMSEGEMRAVREMEEVRGEWVG